MQVMIIDPKCVLRKAREISTYLFSNFLTNFFGFDMSSGKSKENCGCVRNNSFRLFMFSSSISVPLYMYQSQLTKAIYPIPPALSVYYLCIDDVVY